MNEFIKVLLSLTVSGTLLLLLILGLKQFYKNRFSRALAVLYLDNCCISVSASILHPILRLFGSLFEKLGTTSITNENPINFNMPVKANIGNNEREQERENANINTTTVIHNSLNVYTGIFLVWAVLVLVLLFVRDNALPRDLPNISKRAIQRYLILRP